MLSGAVNVAMVPTFTGGTSLTVQVKVSLTLAPFSSVAVTVTVNTPTDGVKGLKLPMVGASGSIVPTMTPVTGSMPRPGGSPVALKVKES